MWGLDDFIKKVNADGSAAQVWSDGTDAPDSALQTGFTGITETESSTTAKNS